MEEQRKKRRSLNDIKKTNEANSVDIKKRLEELRKTTRMIVTKNVTKAKAKKTCEKTFQNENVNAKARNSLKNSKQNIENGQKIVSDENINNKDENKVLNIPLSKDFLPSGYGENYSLTSQRSIVQNPKTKLNDIPAISTSSTPSILSIEEKRSDSSEKLSTPSLNANPLTENFKKIGLLRKPETHDHSFSAIKDFNTNKENVLEMLTPKITGSLDVALKNMEISNTPALASTTLAVTTNNKCRPQHESISLNSYKNMQLSVPGGKLITRSQNSNKNKSEVSSSQVIQDKKENQYESEIKNEIPYWLKPSSVHVYPYNFITAVRKKLEAITYGTQNQARDKEQQYKIIHENNPVSLDKNERNKPEENSISLGKNSKYSSETDAAANSDQMSQYSHQSFTDLASKFSSISLDTPHSELTSLQSSKINKNSQKKSSQTAQSIEEDHQDDKVTSDDYDKTTISSSIFSSPQKKTRSTSLTGDGGDKIKNKSISIEQLSPLSHENISKLQIQLKTQNKSANLLNINFERGDNLSNKNKTNNSNSSIHSTELMDPCSKEYFNQFLEDFNRSLSQAIEVNHQLKTTLKKSHEIFSPKSQKENNIEDYVSDFEEDIATTTTSNEDGSESTTIASSSRTANDDILQKSTIKRNSNTNLEPSVFQLTKNTFVAMEDDGVKPLPVSSDTESIKISSKDDNSSTSSYPIETEISNPRESANSSTHRSTIKENVVNSPSNSNSKSSTHSRSSIRTSKSHSPKKQKENDLMVNNSNSPFVHDLTVIRKEQNENYLINSTPHKGNLEKDLSDPPSYNAITSQGKETERKRKNLPDFDETTPNSLNQSQFESSIFSHNGTLSDSTLNYSSIGMYEKLIQNETTKSEHLTALLRLREKALLDRTKGQIAWLEVQKEKYKTKGLTSQISTIKKKQRAILLKMEKERDAIKKLLDSKTGITTQASTVGPLQQRIEQSPRKIPPIEPNRTKLFKGHSPYNQIDVKNREQLKNKIITLTKNSTTTTAAASSSLPTTVTTSKIVRGYELEASPSLEQLLQKREEDLRKRRQHVERLMQWHQRLDQEEAEVLQLERMLIDYNVNNVKPKERQHNRSLSSSSSKYAIDAGGNIATGILSDAEKSSSSIASSSKFQQINKKNNQNNNLKQKEKMERKLKEIDKSLRELNSISTSSSGGGGGGGYSSIHVVDPTINVGDDNEDYVRTTGNKLNKLWRRLTSQNIEKFESNRRYKLCKADLEHLYEEAKYTVLRDFGHEGDDRIAEFLEKTSFCSSQPSSIIDDFCGGGNGRGDDDIGEDIVPRLNLNLSSEHSDNDQMQIASLIPQGNYSPSAAEEEFLGNGSKCDDSKTSTTTITNSSLITTSSIGNDQVKYSVSSRIFHSMDSSQLLTTQHLLQRSWSDTELSSTKQIAKLLNISPSQFSKSQRNISITNDDCPSQEDQTEKVLSKAEKEYLSEETNTKKDDHIPNNNHQNKSISSEPTSSSLLSLKNDNSNRKLSAASSIEEIFDNSYTQTNSSNPTPTDIAIEEKTDEEEKVPSIEIDSTSNDISTELSQNYFPTNSNSITNEIEEDELLHKWNANLENSNSYSEDTFEHSTENEMEKNHNLDNENEETVIDDLSMPQYETTITDDDDNEMELINKNDKESEKNEIMDKNNVENDKEANETDQKSSIIYRVCTNSTVPSSLPSQLYQPLVTTTEITSTNELESRRSQQIMLECEQMKQFENVAAVPAYMYVREIPNKPPPPYVPPAHGSPMTAIFPSEERIKDITYRRTRELYHEMLKTDLIDENGKKIPSVMDEKITNIYERIILDICREYLNERSDILKKSDPTNFHSPLAFFNPPDRLQCIQEFVYKEVRRCLAMDKKHSKRHHQSNCAHQTYSFYGPRAKRDHIGKIIIEEMYEEDDKWCNFHQEENEVVSLIIDEMIVNVIRSVAIETIIEEGGCINENINDMSEENEMSQDQNSQSIYEGNQSSNHS